MITVIMIADIYIWSQWPHDSHHCFHNEHASDRNDRADHKDCADHDDGYRFETHMVTVTLTTVMMLSPC